MNKLKPKLIVIDDEADLANLIKEIANREGFNTQVFTDGYDFIKKFIENIDVILLDLMMPNIDGIEVLRHLAKNDCQAQLIIMSGVDAGVLHSAEQLAQEQNLDLVATIKKPFRHNELRKLLRSLSITPKSTHTKAHAIKPSYNELYKAIQNDEIIVYYQPKLDLKTTTLGVEVLVRWQHPEHGLLGPDTFIPLAEKEGLIDELTWEIMEQSMKQCALWNDIGLEVKVSINMSASTLKDLGVPALINKIIKKHNLKTSQIALEITETALMEELTTSLDILTRLRLKGIELSIDDFGTGYSSLVQLHRAPFSEIKIDQSFVMSIDKDEESRAIAETIVVLGHKLGMKVVAEGIESEKILQELIKMDCDIAQGYHISRPQSASVITKWLQNQVKMNLSNIS